MTRFQEYYVCVGDVLGYIDWPLRFFEAFCHHWGIVRRGSPWGWPHVLGKYTVAFVQRVPELKLAGEREACALRAGGGPKNHVQKIVSAFQFREFSSAYSGERTGRHTTVYY